ncbi:MAG TPA: MATE family efflux transporter [Steroidobacteraceae bacterium]|jgi:putative MATE family efflux protein|nr:MATE family efflux transporter [Steroidobacteraceae bacterium]
MPQHHNLTEGSISRRLLLFALPILFGNILQSLNATVNSFWIGHYLGEAAMAGSSNASIVLFLILGAMIGASLAATILIGQYLGARRPHDAKRVVGTSTTFAASLSIVMAIVGWYVCEPLLRLMQTPPQALTLAVDYMRVIFLALPFMVLYIFATSALRGAGDAKTPLYFLFLSVGLDIALNPVFIFGVGPIPRLGIAGSALATLLAQAISLVVLVAYLYGKKHPLCLHGDEIKLLKIDWSIVSTLIGKGVPMALQMMVLSLSMVFMISLVNGFGVETAAAYGAGVQLWNYIQMPSFAIGMAVSSMAAQNIGAQKWDRISAITRTGVIYQLILTGTMVLIVDVFCRSALGLFLPPGSDAITIGVHLNNIVTWSFVFFGISMVLFGVVRANGAVVAPLIVLAISLLGFRFPMALTLLGRLHADAIWWSFPASSFLAVVLAMAYYKWGKWRTLRMITPQAAAAQAAADAAGAEIV